jgi:hypothetical protein
MFALLPSAEQIPNRLLEAVAANGGRSGKNAEDVEEHHV